MKLSRIISILLLSIFPRILAGEEKHYIDIHTFGAIGDGIALDSPAINKAIDSATANDIVQIPPGNYRCLSIHLKSNLTLQIDLGATLIASQETPEARFDQPEPNPFADTQDFGHSHWHNSIIWGENLENVSILGQGRIWGKDFSRGHKRPEDPADKALAFKNCTNISIKEITILNGGHFAILCSGVDHLSIDHVNIDTNRDGIDLDSCRNGSITNSRVNSPTDDGICLKSTSALGKLTPCENITVDHCYLSGYDEGSMLDQSHQKKDPKNLKVGPVGRIKLGTESAGGFKNISITNCEFDYCRGLAIESVDGGTLEDVAVSNIKMTDIYDSPIFIRLGGRNRGAQQVFKDKSVLRRVKISNIDCTSCTSEYPCIISGIPELPVEDIDLNNIQINFTGHGKKAFPTTLPSESVGVYPEPVMFGHLPGYALYSRHVKGLSLIHCTFNLAGNDLRPPMYIEDTQDCVINNLKTNHSPNVPSMFLKQIKNINLNDSSISSFKRDLVESETIE